MVFKFYVLDLRILEIQCQSIILDSIQLHLFSIQFLFFIILVFMDLNLKKFNLNDAESQLN